MIYIFHIIIDNKYKYIDRYIKVNKFTKYILSISLFACICYLYSIHKNNNNKNKNKHRIVNHLKQKNNNVLQIIT